ncbi:DNA modification methylase [Flexibacter flexilis DSM 6793]|uniref:Methyltransferase n=1 Tax=Flexibacter flexilis DSM 6793 TaxID=927664 RepID=A0A1I1E6I2_9BACT|nr:DNA methyltransferase [Flexibacter flexilis]SFB80513.1 DNA modification methylase [Flexibacter flexilis DSM 6793]
MITLLNTDFANHINNIPDKSVDIVCIDPPYLYLKHKLDIPFNEKALFDGIARIIKPEGFVILFGRGTSFYRWNTMLAELGFNFKEEIIWDKSQCSSPLMAISRVHETVSLWSIIGKIHKVKVPYLEMKKHDIGSIVQDIKRMRSIFKDTKSMQAVLDFLENNTVAYHEATYKHRHADNGEHGTMDRCVAVERSTQEGLNEKSIIRSDFSGDFKKNVPTTLCGTKAKDGLKVVTVAQSMACGCNEKSIIRSDYESHDKFTKHYVNADKRCSGNRCTDVAQSITFGLNEKSIIKQVRDHYSAIHPTQKPVKLLKRIMALCFNKKTESISVVDFFAGSGSTLIATLELSQEYPNIQFNGLGCEIDKGYYEDAKQRIDGI